MREKLCLSDQEGKLMTHMRLLDLGIAWCRSKSLPFERRMAKSKIFKGFQSLVL